MLVLMLTIALAALAMSAIFLTSNAGVLSHYYDRERAFRYAAEAAVAQGKSRLQKDPSYGQALPDSGYETMIPNGDVVGADGNVMPGVKIEVHVGHTGIGTGQYNVFASVVAVAKDDASKARYVRRLELQEENFARWAVFADNATAGCYGTGEVITGPFWANSDLLMCGGEMKDYVGLAGGLSGGGTFKAGYPKGGQARINLPTIGRLAKMPGYAAEAGYSFIGTNSAAFNLVQTRLEFVGVDLDGDGKITGEKEGFFRVFNGSNPAAVRAEVNVGGWWTNGSWGPTEVGGSQCGLLITPKDSAGPEKGQPSFIAWGARKAAWVRPWLDANTTTAALPNAVKDVLGQDDIRAFFAAGPIGTRRCYQEGDPHLNYRANGGAGAGVDGAATGPGTDSTFVGDWTANVPGAKWVSLADQGLTPEPAVVARVGAGVANYLFPLSHELNPGFKGIIYFNGSVNLSGVMRGRATVLASQSVGFADDLTYATSPNALPKRCLDLLGVIAGEQATVVNNSINYPVSPDNDRNNGKFMYMTGNTNFNIDGVVMALNGGFGVENIDGAPYGVWTENNNNCNGTSVSGGCISQNGGMIERDLLVTFYWDGRGFAEARSYDTCMATQSPPYFPTTGRYFDNRYYEIDPVRFDVEKLFRQLTPRR